MKIKLMAAAASLATQISTSRNRSSILSFLPNNAFVPKTGTHLLHPTTTSMKRLPLICASSKPQRDDSADDNAAFVSQEDVKYLVQLGGASVAGAAAIKYGSIIFPEITQPNLAQALFMIFAPVIVAVLVLFKQSSVD